MIKDLTGQKFDRLLVLEFYDIYKKGSRWKCLCDCGTECLVQGASLTSHRTRSCGCLKKESDNSPKGGKDLTGQKFGHLTVIRRCGNDNRGEILWECSCDCGNPDLIRVLGSNLRTGHTTSCGCLRCSHGESKIASILVENHIPFSYEISAFKFKDTGMPARFDFLVDNKYFIEYDGETHFRYNLHGWHNQEQLLAQQRRDRLKDDWCREQGISLIRIPYTVKNISLNDLLLSEGNPYITVFAGTYFTRDDLGNADENQTFSDKIDAACVSQFSLDGEYIATYYSYDDIFNKTGATKYCIKECIKGKQKSCKGFLWREGTDATPIDIDISDRSPKMVYQYTLDGELVHLYNSPAEAAKAMNVRATKIYDCCRKKQKTSKGYIWSYSKK